MNATKEPSPTDPYWETRQQIVRAREKALADARAEVEQLKAGIAEERERCVASAKDWFTLPPKMRTKENLIALLRREQITER